MSNNKAIFSSIKGNVDVLDDGLIELDLVFMGWQLFRKRWESDSGTYVPLND